MKSNLNIGLDFDNVLVSYPPLVPPVVIDSLYKKRNSHLSYRFPGNLERKIRILSHFWFFRPAIKKNLSSIIDAANKYQNLYLISSRYSFLKKRTDYWIKKYGLSKYFRKMYFNYDNEQPHQFKERIIRKEKIEKFVDDDLDLLLHLAEKIPGMKFYWLNPRLSQKGLPANITHIRSLEEFFAKYV